MRAADFEKMSRHDQARLLRDRSVYGTESGGQRLTVLRFTDEDHRAAEREGFIKQINSFSQKGNHREFGQYDFRDGVYGEIAFAAWAGIERVVAEQGVLTDGGVDFIDRVPIEGSTRSLPVTAQLVRDYRDIKIDVKATAARGTWHVGKAHLLRPAGFHLKADVYVLLVLDEGRRRARFAGWATRAELEAATIRTQSDDGRPKVYVPTRCIPEADLHHDWRGWA